MAAADFSTLVVCDAGPLIHLEELRCFDLLRDFDEVYIPEAVWREVDRHQRSALRHRRMPFRRVETLPEPTPDLVAHILESSLGEGEAEAFRLLQALPNATLFTDDNAARRVANLMSYRVHGTLGVLLRSLNRGLRTKRQIINLLKAIPRRSTLHVKPDFLADLVAQVQGGRT